MMRSFLTTKLAERYEVLAFSDTSDAQAYLDQHPLPQLIITDYNLASSTGLEWLRCLKASMLFSEIPVLVLSGNKDTKTRIACLTAGASDFLAKPFHPQELHLRIEKELNRSSTLF